MSSLIRQLSAFFLRCFVPARTKRMLILMGLAAQFHQEKDDIKQSEYLTDINSALRLAIETNALLFAIEVGKFLWKDIVHRFNVVKNDYNAIAKEIVLNCPSSLKYADDEVMQTDILNAIRYANQYREQRSV